MMDETRLFAVIDGTWPAARFVTLGPWTLRDGQGGGKRVSAASTDQEVTSEEIGMAEAGMADLGQPPLFMIREGQEALDSTLEARGYGVIDPSVAYAIPAAELDDRPIPRVTVLPHWEPLAIAREIWAEGGIGPARVAVMERAKGPRVALLGRHADKPAGVAYVAVHDGVAMLHALEILPHQRRKGMGQWMMRAAAHWARANDADLLSVICTRANAGANALYASLGMGRVGSYHYRHLPEEGQTS